MYLEEHYFGFDGHNFTIAKTVSGYRVDMDEHIAVAEIDTANMTAGITLTSIEQTCDACPSQWDAHDTNGIDYYIRYRWGQLTVSRNLTSIEEIYAKDIGNGLDGVMSTEDMLRHSGMTLSDNDDLEGL